MRKYSASFIQKQIKFLIKFVLFSALLEDTLDLNGKFFGKGNFIRTNI